MDSKIEQVKKILYQGYLTDIAAEKINALYSEPHVVINFIEAPLRAEIAELRVEIIECNNEIEILTDFKVRSMDEYEKAEAEIAELKADIEELNILSRCNSEVYDTRIKELKGLTDSLQEKIETIRADQNKKIGERILAIIGQKHT